MNFVVNRILALENGTILRDPRIFIHEYHGKEIQIELPVYSFLLDTSAGFILIDTGFHKDIHANVNGEAEVRKIGSRGDTFYITKLLENVGIQPSDIKFVILTHLHYDHAGGLSSFSGTRTRFLVRKEELEFALVSDLCYGNFSYRRRDLPSGSNWVLISDNSLELGASLKLTKVGGHTPGSQVVEVTTKKQNKYLILGDLIHMHEEYEFESTGTAALTNDLSSWQDSVRRLKFLDEECGVKMLFSHDRRMREAGNLVFE